MRKIIVIILLILGIVLLGCKQSNIKNNKKNEITEEYIESEETIQEEETIDKSENVNIKEKSKGYKITDNIFESGSIRIIYPVISNLNNEILQQVINENIYLRVESISNYYDINRSPTMDISYIIKTANEDIISIVLQGYVNCDDTAYPTSFFETINLDLNTGDVLKVSDLVNIDDEFISKLKASNPINNSYVDNTYLSSFSDDEVKEMLIYADNEDSNVYSYVLEDGSIGISINVPHALGDYLEYEVK